VIKSRNIRWTGHIAHTGDMKNEYTILARKREKKKRLKIQKLRLEDNIKTNLEYVRCGHVDWIQLAVASLGGFSSKGLWVTVRRFQYKDYEYIVLLMNWNGFGRKLSWPERDTVRKMPGGTQENHEKLKSG
jgi:hypothetical protein